MLAALQARFPLEQTVFEAGQAKIAVLVELNRAQEKEKGEA